MEKKLTILVIGNLQDNIVNLKAILKEAFPEAKILTAQTGKKGLELAAIEDHDVILLEMLMPDMGGFEVCKKLKADDRSKDIPVVFITASNENRKNLIQALEAGADGFVNTPVCDAEIIAQVRVMAKIKTANTINRKEKQRLDAQIKVGTNEPEREPEDRSRMEAALHENEDKFRAVFETANVGKSITLLSGEINVNQAFCDMLGYEPDELNKKKWFDLTPSEDIAPTQSKLNLLLKGEKNDIRFEKRYIHKNGSFIWTDVSVALHRDESGNPLYFITTVIDISQRKRAENELIENQSHLSLFFNQSIYGYYTTVLENPLDWEHLENKDEILDHIADHQFIAAINDTMCVQYGLSKEQLIGRPISAFFKNELENGHQFRKKLFDEGQFHIETLEYKDDGSPVWFEGDYKCVYDSQNRIVGTFGIQIDITRRKLSEEALNENRSMVKMILDTIPQSIFWKNSDGRYLGCNGVFAKAAGLNDPDEIIGKTDFDLPWPARETLAYREDDKEVIESRRPKLHIIEPLQKADGTRLWIDTSKVPLLDEKGNPFALLGIFDNITERKLSQEKLRQSEEKFRNFFEESPIGIEIYNADGHLLQLNQACLEIFGVTDVSEIKSFNLFDDPNITDENKARLKLGKLVRYQSPFDFEKVKKYQLYQTSKSGISFLDVRITPLGETAADASGGYLVQVIDITDLKRAEKTLRDSEERYSLVYNASRDSIYSYDTSGRFTSANRSFCESLNLKPDQIIGHTHAELGYPEELCKEWEELHQQVYDTNDTVTSESTASMPDGKLRNFEIVLNPLHDYEGNIVGIGGTTRDVTEKKQAEEERLRLFKNEKAAREELNILLERISDGFVAFDNQMNYTFVNEAGAKLLGREARDLVGKNYWQEFPEAKTTPFAKAYIKALETQEPIFIEEYYEPWDRWFANTIHPSDNGISIIFQEITERKRAEKALIENEKKFRSYIENAPEGIIVVNEKGQYLETNAATEQITGYSRTELVGTNILDITHPDDLMLAEQHFSRVSVTGEADGELRFIRKDGEIRHWTVKAVKLTDNRLIGFVADITARKQTEQALRESERKLKEAQHIAKLGNWELDLLNNKLSWSDEIYQIFDTEKSSINVSYDVFLDAIYPDDRNKVSDAYEASLKTKTPYSVEHRLLTKSGILKYVVENCITHYDLNGNPLRSVGTIQDITSQKLASEQINDLRNRYQSLFENSLIGTGLATADGKIIDCNEAFATILGRTIDELKTLNVKGFYVNPDERTRMLEELRKKQVLKNFETKLKRNDGTHIDVLINISLVNLQGENYFQTTCLDITESKKAKEALQDEQRRLEGILYGTNAGTWEWNIQTGETIFNERWAEILGYSLAEISPVSIETWQKFAHPDDLKASGELLEKHFIGELDYYEFESRMKHKNGSWIWVLDRGRLISRTSDGKPLMIMGTHQDITSRKQAEEALRDSEARYRGLLTNLDVGIVVHTPDTSILHYNSKALEIMGLSDDQMLGKQAFDPQWEFLDENGNKLPLELYPVKQVVSGKKSFKNQIIGMKRSIDSQVTWVTVNGMPILDANNEIAEIVISFIDITGQKTFEKALQEKEERWRTIIRTSPDGIVVTSLDGMIQEASDNAFKMYNYASAQEVIGHDIIKYVHESDRQKSLLSFSEILNGKYLGLSEFKVVKKDGTPFFVEINADVIHDKDGNPQNIIFVQRDITGRKRTETIQQIQYNVARSILTAERVEDLLEIVRNELSKVIDTSNFMVALYNPEKDTLKQLISNDRNDNSIEWESQNYIA